MTLAVSDKAFVWSYSVARAAAYWLPCCWSEGEVGPAVAMVAGVQKGEEAAGCWGEEVAVASCPLEVAADLQGHQKSDIFFLCEGLVQFILVHF